MLVLDNDDGGDGSDGVDDGSLSERVSIVYFVCSCQKKKEILISPFFTLFSFFFLSTTCNTLSFLFISLFLSHSFVPSIIKPRILSRVYNNANLLRARPTREDRPPLFSLSHIPLSLYYMIERRRRRRSEEFLACI